MQTRPVGLYALALTLTAMAFAPPAVAEDSDPVAALRAELDSMRAQYEARIAALEARLAELEARGQADELAALRQAAQEAAGTSSSTATPAAGGRGSHRWP